MLLRLAAWRDVKQGFVIIAVGTDALNCRPFQRLLGADFIGVAVFASFAALAVPLVASAISVQLTPFAAPLRVDARVFILMREYAIHTAYVI
jgi:hypothetical protein